MMRCRVEGVPLTDHVEVPAEGDETWEGPEIPGLQRRLKASEGRLFWKRVGLTPLEAVAWVAAHLGPYDAERAGGMGLDVQAYLAWRHERRGDRAAATDKEVSEGRTRLWATLTTLPPDQWEQWRSAGFSAEAAQPWVEAGFVEAPEAAGWSTLVLTVRSPGPEPDELEVPFGWSPDESVTWRRLGIDPRTAALWSLRGMNPQEAVDAAGRGDDPSAVNLDELDENWTAVWAVVHGYLRVIQLRDAWWLCELARTIEAVAAAESWHEIREVLGSEVLEDEFGTVFDFAWRRESSNDANRPSQWLPRELTEWVGYWVQARSRGARQLFAEFPAELLAGGERIGSCYRHHADWTLADFPTLAAACRRRGLPLVWAPQLVADAIPPNV